MEHRSRIFCLAIALCVTGCNSASSASGSDPVADAKRALAQGDRRVVGYMGYAMVVPGTPPGFQRWSYAPGVKVVSSVTDTSARKDIEQAADYATRYNQVVLGSTGGAP